MFMTIALRFQLGLHCMRARGAGRDIYMRVSNSMGVLLGIQLYLHFHGDCKRLFSLPPVFVIITCNS